ncbi:phospholipase A and acyltransferase 4-like isoform X2 [Anguilla anguilla]|uniref:phospholipase A and acyltransferase 4-like isoform X2 n=1 Tax=Anguilla anguilla TaxID=7936 RepID=UPI0015A7F484|nr:phospholipase A and acyltransferase 4-like isoform X2 [Anguilla anguilla]
MDYKEQVREVVSKAQFGDLIEFSYPIGFSHWGVYDGDGHVIHFAVPDEEPSFWSWIRAKINEAIPVSGDILIGRTQIRRQRVADVNVPSGAHVMISNHSHAFRPSPVEEMRRRRDALLGREFQYNLIHLNCEHFATFVRFGKAVCNQFPGRTDVECKEATEMFRSI